MKSSGHKGTMKSLSNLAVPLLFAACACAVAQTPTNTVPPPLEKLQVVAQTRVAGESGEHLQNWINVTTVRTRDGRLLQRTNLAYVELETGMHYWDGQKHVRSQALIEAYPGGAIARHGRHQVVFAENLNRAVVVDLQTPDGKRLQSRVLGLGYYDPSVGKSALIAQVKDSPGQIISSNEILYADAFSGADAAVRYTYKKSGLAQDVILIKQPPPPADFGFNPETTRLQVLTEFVDTAAPTLKTATATPTADELANQTLSFGEMYMAQGKAFAVGPSNVSKAKATVAKRWVETQGRSILVEEVQLDRIKAALQTLPAPIRTASLGTRLSPMLAQADFCLPEAGPAQRERSERTMEIAKTSAQVQGFVVDYDLESRTYSSGYTFTNGTTYKVSGVVNIAGTTTIEGGTVVKFAAGGGPQIVIYGLVNCQTAPYRPAIFTAVDDNSVGEVMGSGTPGTTKYGSGLIVTTAGNGFTNLHFAYLERAFTSQAHLTTTLRDAQFVSCRYPVTAEDTSCWFICGVSVNLHNALVQDCDTFFQGDRGTLRAEHVTLNQCGTLGVDLGEGASPHFTNSVFVGVTSLGSLPDLDGSHNGFYGSPAFGLNQIPATSSPFRSPGVGAGNHYLKSDSSFRSVGTTAINPALLTYLRKKTTQPPVVRSDLTTTTATTLAPQAERDADAPDLGYHYDPIDYIAYLDRYVGCNLTINPATVIAYYDYPGFWLQDNAAVACTGTPLQPIRVVDYRGVQEQPVKLGSYPGNSTGIPFANNRLNGAAAPAAFRFTEFVRGAHSGYNYYDLYSTDSSWKFTTLDVRDCSFYGGSCSIYGDTLDATLHNNLFVRENFSASGPLTLNLRNNLFLHTGVQLELDADGQGTAYDNVFDHCVLDEACAPGVLAHSHNAYINVKDYDGVQAQINPLQVDSDKVLPSFDYAAGPLGNFYQLSTDLIDQGSRSANDAGLYHHTTQVNQTKEADGTLATVDIGLHYIALNATGAPKDTDNDGLADYWEDTNGNGSFAVGDFSNWNDADTDDDGMPDGWEWRTFNTFVRDGTGDFDGDGTTDAAEYSAGTDPLSRGKIILVVDATLVPPPPSPPSPVSLKIDRLIQDLVGDGWHVLRHDVQRAADTPFNADPLSTSVVNWKLDNNAAVRRVKALIKADYDASPTEVKSVFLLGHVAVPYSGDSKYIAGQHNEGWGAHPADAFYGEMDSPYGTGGWTDTSINNSIYLTDWPPQTPWPPVYPQWPYSIVRDMPHWDESTSPATLGYVDWWGGRSVRPVLVNAPGDGSFDQAVVPSVSGLELCIGRVDLYAMPHFYTDSGLNETALVANYLNKDHDFRCREGYFQTEVQRRVLLASWAGGPFKLTSTQKAGFEAVFGQTAVHEYDNLSMHWFAGTPGVSGGHASVEDYLVGYGGGFGAPPANYASGVGWTYVDEPSPPPEKPANNFVGVDSRVVFMNLYGSFFGSWDQPDDFLRAPLANPYDPTTGRHGYGLAAIYGRTEGLDETSLTKRVLGACIGEAIFKGYRGDLHFALMGDPTLRMHTVAPPTRPLPPAPLAVAGSTVSLVWIPSPDTVSGYNIYRAPTENGPWTLVNPGNAPVTDSAYSAIRPVAPDFPDNFYMVRAVKTETVAVAPYQYVNMSEGIIFDMPGPLTSFLKIVSEPSSQTVTVDGTLASAAFTVDAVGVEAAGSHDLAFQWFKVGNPNPITEDDHFTGVTTRALLIRGVQLGDAGGYYVEVSNGYGSETSVPATLTTTSSP